MNFWMALFGILTIASAMGVVVSQAPLNSALWLVITFFMIAIHYGMLGADFLSAVQIMVYAGAIMVLVIFVIMLLGAEAHVQEGMSIGSWIVGGIISLALFGGLVFAFSKPLPIVTSAPQTPDGSAAGLGSKLFSEFLFPFELTSLLILGAIVGAVVLGADRKRPLMAGRGLKATRKKVEEELKKVA